MGDEKPRASFGFFVGLREDRDAARAGAGGVEGRVGVDGV